MQPPFPILHEDNHLLVVNKPAGLATMGVQADTPSLLEQAKRYIKVKYNKPGKVYLGIVSRLDAPVTGALVIARTSKAAARLTEAFRAGDVEKAYWAVVEQPPDPPAGRLVDWMIKDERHRKMHTTHENREGAKEARLTYRTLRRLGHKKTLLEVKLETGRKHQIRVQFSRHGWPIVGDRKYGAVRQMPKGIALHSRWLRFEHPVGKAPLEFTAQLPDYWTELGVLDDV